MSIPEPNTGCWLWLGGSIRGGYGITKVSGQSRLAHRASYAEYVGDPGKQYVMHKCDTPACVNPGHLALGSPRDNAIDATHKGHMTFAQASKEQRQAWYRQPSVSGIKAELGLSLSERIDRLSITEPNTGCHLWIGAINSGGYGKIKVNGHTCRASRVSYLAKVGPIADGLFVLHKCDTPACVNPAHLFLGTAKDNIMDATRKGRSSLVRASKSERTEWVKKRIAHEREHGHRPDITRNGWITRRKNGREHVMTSEASSERTKKAWITRVERYGQIGVSHEWSRSDAAKRGWSNLTPEEHTARASLLTESRRQAREARNLAIRRPALLRFNLLVPRVA
jgi:HNH endonuclease